MTRFSGSLAPWLAPVFLVAAVTVARSAAGQLRPPPLLHWCSQHCSTWVWAGDRYVGQGTQHPELTPKCGVTVERFSSDSVIMHRTDCAPYPGKATLTGRLSSDGNSILDGRIVWTWHPCCGLTSGTYTAAWGAAIDTVPGSDPERERMRMAHAQPPGPAPSSDPPARPVDVALQNSVCTSPSIRVAMQSLEDRAIHDPNGAALQLLTQVFIGIDASASCATILDSKIGTDGGRYTSKDPGSFVCRGLFVHGGVEIKETDDADEAAELTAETMQQIMSTRPSFIEWFKVKQIQDGTYHLTLLPSSLQLAREYSGDFPYPPAKGDRTTRRGGCKQQGE